MTSLKENITQFLGYEPENLEQVLSRFALVSSKRGDLLLREGEVCQAVYFILKGSLQVFVLDDKGAEWTRDFYFENQWVTNIFSIQNRTESKEAIRCLEPCDLMMIKAEDFGFLMESIPQFKDVYQKILELSYNSTVYKVNTLTSLSAADKLKWLLENQPKILSRISSKLVASYLGMTPETLTRLKAKL